MEQFKWTLSLLCNLTAALYSSRLEIFGFWSLKHLIGSRNPALHFVLYPSQAPPYFFPSISVAVTKYPREVPSKKTVCRLSTMGKCVMIRGLWWNKTGQLVALERQQGGRNKRSPPRVCPRCSSFFTSAFLPFTKERLPVSSILKSTRLSPGWADHYCWLPCQHLWVLYCLLCLLQLLRNTYFSATAESVSLMRPLPRCQHKLVSLWTVLENKWAALIRGESGNVQPCPSFESVLTMIKLNYRMQVWRVDSRSLFPTNVYVEIAFLSLKWWKYTTTRKAAFSNREAIRKKYPFPLLSGSLVSNLNISLFSQLGYILSILKIKCPNMKTQNSSLPMTSVTNIDDTA